MEAGCELDYFIVRQLSRDCNGPASAGCDASGISLSFYNAEEKTKKQRVGPRGFTREVLNLVHDIPSSGHQ